MKTAVLIGGAALAALLPAGIGLAAASSPGGQAVAASRVQQVSAALPTGRPTVDDSPTPDDSPTSHSSATSSGTRTHRPTPSGSATVDDKGGDRRRDDDSRHRGRGSDDEGSDDRGSGRHGSDDRGVDDHGSGGHGSDD